MRKQLGTVSYTHLDVYKRQEGTASKICGEGVKHHSYRPDPTPFVISMFGSMKEAFAKWQYHSDQVQNAV